MIKMVGLKEFEKVLDQVPNEIEKRGHLSAARKAAKPIRDGAKEILKSYSKGTDNGFSKLHLLATQIKTETYKGIINIQISRRAIDIPLQLRGRDGFSAFGYARLIAQGRNWTAKTTNARRSYYTGRTQGIGDYIEKSFNENFPQSIGIYKRERIPSIKKAFDRAVIRYGRR